MDSTTYNNSDLKPTDNNFDVGSVGRNYGLELGVVTSLYLILLNLISGDVSVGMRFAKHLLIIPVVWMAVDTYAKRLPDGKVFNNELGLLLRIALWSAITVATVNVLFFGFAGTSFEQFMQQGNTLASVMVNSGFLIFETAVFVMIIGFTILQAYKGKGAPEA